MKVGKGNLAKGQGPGVQGCWLEDLGGLLFQMEGEMLMGCTLMLSAFAWLFILHHHRSVLHFSFC
jgi:hypothetical protein